MNYVKQIEFSEPFTVKDGSYKQTAYDIKSDVARYFLHSENGGEDKNIFSIAGEAGTGKTTFLKKYLIPDLEENYDVQYFSILNVLETFETNQPDLKQNLYQKMFQYKNWKGMDVISDKIDTISTVFIFFLTAIWTGFFVALSMYGIYIPGRPGYIAYLAIASVISVGFVAMVIWNFILMAKKSVAKVGITPKLKKHGKRRIIFIDDLNRISLDLEKEIMINLTSMRDFQAKGVDTLFFLVNSNRIIFEEDEDGDFANKFIYSIYDMTFGEELINSIFTNKARKPTAEDMKYLKGIHNLRDLNSYIRELYDTYNTENPSLSKTSDKELQNEILDQITDKENLFENQKGLSKKDKNEEK